MLIEDAAPAVSAALAVLLGVAVEAGTAAAPSLPGAGSGAPALLCVFSSAFRDSMAWYCSETYERARRSIDGKWACRTRKLMHGYYVKWLRGLNSPN